MRDKKFSGTKLPLLAELFKQARARKRLTQAAIEAELGLYGGKVSRWEKGACIEDVAAIRRLCHVLDIDFALCLEVWSKCETDPALKAGVCALLEDFQQVFKRDLHGINIETLIMGDRRKTPPEHVTDFALQVSISDLFFLAELRRPIHIWFDKLVVGGNSAAVPAAFRHHDILMVGSPAVNLATRLVNATAAFRFFIGDDIVQLEKDLGLARN